MARILSIVRCRPEDEGGGTFGSSTPPRDNQGGTPPLDPPLYYTSDLCILMYLVRVSIKKTAGDSPKFRDVALRTGARINEDDHGIRYAYQIKNWQEVRLFQ